MARDWSLQSSEDREAVAAWAAMTTMVIEQAHPPTAVVPQSQRTFLMETSKVPEGWYVGIGRYFGVRFQGSFYHRSLIIQDEGKATEIISEEDSLQTTLFGAGGMIVNTVSVHSAARLKQVLHDPGLYGDAHGLRSYAPEYHAGLATFDGDLIKDGTGDLQAIVDCFGSPTIDGPAAAKRSAIL